MSSLEPHLRSLLRVVAGFAFSLHGYQKFFGWFGGMGGTRPPLDSLLGFAGVLETFGGALIILGLFTRPTAFILSGPCSDQLFAATQYGRNYGAVLLHILVAVCRWCRPLEPGPIIRLEALTAL